MATEAQARTSVRSVSRSSSGMGSIIPKHWYAHLILLIAILIIGFPLFYAMLISTQNTPMVFNHQLTPGPYFWDNLETVMNDRNMGRFMLNSAFIAGTIAIGKTIMSILAGLGLVYFRYPGKWLVFGFILVTLIMPGDVYIIGLLRRVNSFEHWPHPYVGLTLPLLASATSVFLFRQHFMSMPPDLSEAAQLDGANPVQFLMRVLIPMSWNTIGAIVVIMFLFGWNQFLWPLIYLRTDTELQVVQWGMNSLSQAEEVGEVFGPQMMGVIITSLPPLIIFLLLQKQFMSGFSLTRDK